MRTAVLTLVVLTSLFAGCTAEQPSATTTSAATTDCSGVGHMDLDLQNHNHTVLILATDKGCIYAELYDDKAPITVANFKKLVQNDFYKSLLFHRIIKGFMVQTGGMGTDGKFKESPFPPIKNEATTSGLKNLKYTLSMARTSAPDSATNQFFINHDDNCNLDPRSNSACPDNAGADGYAVFGKVVKGQDVVETIASSPTTLYNAPGANPHCQPEAGSASCPKTDIVLQRIRLL